MLIGNREEGIGNRATPTKHRARKRREDNRIGAAGQFGALNSAAIPDSLIPIPDARGTARASVERNTPTSHLLRTRSVDTPSESRIAYHLRSK